MVKFQFPGGFALEINLADKKLRLLITNQTGELACRKETWGSLKRFLASDATKIFKGRLQLRKEDKMLAVVLNGITIGVIERPKFERELDQIAGR